MANRRKNKQAGFAPFLLLILLLVIAAGIIKVGVPWLGAQMFGVASPYLTAGQTWSYSAQLLLHREALLQGNCAQSKTTPFTINPGDSVTTIAGNLAAQGVIQDGAALRAYLIYTGLDTQIRADEYQLDCALPAVEIARQIKNPYLEEVVFSILPGWRAEEIAAALPTSGIEVSPEAFLAVVHDPQGLELPGYIPAGSSLEGFLFPGEYQVKRDISAEQLAQMFVDRFNSNIDQGIYSELTVHGLDFYQAITLASIVQRETYDDGERPMIASVFYNRLALGMNLETDPTVQYALGYSDQFGWWKSPLSASDLQVDSPFNTYLNGGLPPAPIANPDLAAILAVARPESSDYLYFRAVCDGSGTHLFARTFEEHLANACK